MNQGSNHNEILENLSNGMIIKIQHINNTQCYENNA